MDSRNNKRRGLWATGEPFVWLTAGALSITILSIVLLIGVIAKNGLGVMWPSRITQLTLAEGETVAGKIVQREQAGNHSPARVQVKTANRDLYGLDFRWIPQEDIADSTIPEDLVVLERREWGDFYGYLQPDPSGDAWPQFQAQLAESRDRMEALSEFRDEIAALNHAMMRNQERLAKLEYAGDGLAEREAIAARLAAIGEEFNAVLVRQSEATNKVRARTVTLTDAAGTEKEIVLADIVRAYRPNSMGVTDKVAHYGAKIVELLTDEPRESNTEGGLFPAIFGTVILIFLMSILSFPLGVVAGIYLRLYAKNGPVLYIVRIAVNNLAGIPSIVYGIFGLGFFIYGIGGTIDEVFFPHRLPTPTYGTGGILWASLTLGLLTVPVVIVATEEGLGSVPRSMREGSYALGATRFQTLVHVLLPMAAPGVMTGFILAMARAAGEVAPLMITGVVKLAPALPVDLDYPFVHLDRKFMHLGFHIYDIGFQSPNVEAAKPMVFVTALLLVLIVMVMSSAAIYFRNQIRKRHSVTHL